MGSRPTGGTTSRTFRDGAGLALVALSVGALGLAVWTLLGRDYVGAMLLSTIGLAVLRAAVALLQPSMGE